MLKKRISFFGCKEIVTPLQISSEGKLLGGFNGILKNTDAAPIAVNKCNRECAGPTSAPTPTPTPTSVSAQIFYL